MVTYLFILTLLTELILGGSLILTLTWPEFRIWPPPGRESNVLSNSWLALITGLIGTLWFVLAPFTEEPWLRERYGQQYEAYKKRVPRFIGRPWK